MKTELLIQMDGVRGSAQQTFVMAASNLPWDLDVAVLRRFQSQGLQSPSHDTYSSFFRLEKRVLVSLPTREAREHMLRRHLEDRSVASIDYEKVCFPALFAPVSLI